MEKTYQPDLTPDEIAVSAACLVLLSDQLGGSVEPLSLSWAAGVIASEGAPAARASALHKFEEIAGKIV